MKEFSLIRPIHLGLLALVYLPVIPPSIYCCLVLITLLYLGHRQYDEAASLSSGQRHPHHAALFGSKRFQQLWFAVKRFSPIHRPRTSAQAGDDEEEEEDGEEEVEDEEEEDNGKHRHHHHHRRKLSASENEHLVHDTAAGSCRLSWSPFARRKHHHHNNNNNNNNTKEQYGLYSSHPEISIHSIHPSSQHPQDGEEKMLRIKKEKMELSGGHHDVSSSHSKSSSSPLSRIKKIKRDMQRCVTRDSSSDYELCDQNGSLKPNNSSSRDKAKDEENVQLLANNAIINSADLKEDCATTNNGGYKQSSIEHFDDDDLENFTSFGAPQLDSLIGQPELPSGGIPLDKVENYETILQRQKISKLLKYPFYQVDIHLRSASNLLAKDSCGTSDPYVKFKVGNQIIHKSRTIFKTLNPIWDEYFVVPVDDIFEPIVLKVYDHDLLFVDDYLGSTHIDLTKLEPNVSTELELFLHENDDVEKANVDEKWGKVVVSVKLNPKSQEEKEHFYGRGKWVTSFGVDGPSKKVRTQAYDSVVNVMLIRGNNISLETDYCIKFKLANEKYKSKVVAKTTSSPYWGEQFDLRLFTDQSKVLEITLCGANQSASDFIEKSCIDLSELPIEKSHQIVQKFNVDQRSIELLVTITGSQQGPPSANNNNNNHISSSNLNCPVTRSRTYADICKKYNFLHSLNELPDVGHLIVKVYKAENLVSADINGKSDPFCVLELVNERLRTGTEYKTLCPEWNKVFEFNIKDIHEVLEVTVYDEDKDRCEFLGKVAIPLLKIKSGEKKWYALKDKKLQHRVKGHVQLEFWISFNNFKASVRTFTPREPKYIHPEIKFKRALFVRNAIRLKNVCMELLEWGQFLNSCIQWESPTRSLIAFIFFLTFVYFFELYMVPQLLLLLLLKNFIWQKIEAYFNPNHREEEIEFIDETAFDEDDDEKAEEKKSLKEKLQTVQEISTVVMNIIGEIASYIERIKNTSNFSVPFLSWLAVIVLSIATLILYHIPIRYLILAWGVNKFTKKFRAPDAINNNELLDFLSRVPDIDQKMMYKEFKPNVASDYKSNQQSPSQNGPIHAAASTTPRSSTLSKNASFKSDLSVASVESASDNRKNKKKK